MKHNRKTALTAAVFATAIGVSFTGSIPAEADTAQYLAATDQREMQILYGPGPNIEREIEGDINADRVLDARDLTLMKQKLLSGDTENYSQRDDFLPDFWGFSGADARALMQHLTGELYAEHKRPVEFHLYFRPVPYFADEAPETAEERQKLVQEAKHRLSRLDTYETELIRYYPKVSYSFAGKQHEFIICPVDNKESDTEEYKWGNMLGVVSPEWLPAEYVPNTFWDGAPEDADYLALRRAEFSVTVPFEADLDPETDSPPDTPVQNSYSGSYVTYIQLPDGSEEYFDKILIEWNVNTGKVRMHDTLTPEQEIPEWEFPG